MSETDKIIADLRETGFQKFVKAHPCNNGVQLDHVIDMNELYELGYFIGDTAAQEGKKIAVAVFAASGQRIFQRALPGASPRHDMFLDRKFRSCQRLSMSTLGLWWYLKDAGETLSQRYGLSETEYAVVGGGIPIYINDLLIAVVAVSGLPHEQDHAFPAECMKEFFNL